MKRKMKNKGPKTSGVSHAKVKKGMSKAFPTGAVGSKPPVKGGAGGGNTDF